MKTATLTDFRANLKKRLQEIEEDQDFLVLTGPKKRDYVVLTLEQYNSMEETVHLLSTQNNSRRLMESIDQDKENQVDKKNI